MSTDKKTVELVDKSTTASAIIENLQGVDLTKPLPDLKDADTVPFDLMADYWTPTQPGESKRLFFDSLKMRNVIDQQDKEVVIELMCAYFFEKDGDVVKIVSNGSKRLVGIFETGQIQRGTPLLVTYLGKQKNKSNQFMSDRWSVKPLLIKL